MIGLKVDMKLVTQLTREGRLHEAMAVLQGKRLDASDQAPSHNGDARRETTQTMQLPDQKSGSPVQGLTDLLGGVLGRKVQGLAGHSFGQPATPLPDKAKFYERAFSNNAGTRTYKVYVPSGYIGQPLPLIVMLHGCTQTPDDFAAGTRMNELAEEQTFFVVYPAQSQSANVSKCWNWFSASEQQRDQGEPSLIAGITREVMRDFAVKNDQVYVAGLSAGGAAAVVLGAAYPDLYAAIGVHSGLACGAASDIPSAFTAMREGSQSSRSTPGIPTIVFHGDADATVNPRNGDQVIIQGHAKRRLTATCIGGESAGGIHYERKTYRNDAGFTVLEHWILHDFGHAWSGGSSAGSYTEPRGPDASREMVRFFLEHSIRS